MRSNLLYAGMGFVLCFILSPLANNLLSLTTTLPSDIVRANDETITLLGKTAEVLDYKTELLQRLRHYHQDHSVINDQCPECLNRGFDGDEYPPYQPEPRTKKFDSLDDVLQDSLEIHTCLASIRLSTIIQAQSLEIHLNHLREANPLK